MRASWKVVAAAALGVVAGCGTVATATSPAASFERHQSYSLAPLPSGEQALDPNVNESVQAALRQSLAARGFVPATTAPPDFVVAYRVEEHPAWGWLGAANSEFTKGTLTVAYVDPSTSRVLWVGQTERSFPRPVAEDQARLERVVGKVVAHSPRTTM